MVKNLQHNKHNSSTFEQAPVKQAVEMLRSLNIRLSEIAQVDKAISQFLKCCRMVIKWVYMF